MSGLAPVTLRAGVGRGLAGVVRAGVGRGLAGVVRAGVGRGLAVTLRAGVGLGLAGVVWLAVADGADAEAAGTPVPDYVEPVDAPVIDGFRPPIHRYGAGNRGLEYGVRPGQAVRASAAGQVTFAGRIGHHRYVTISHADRVRTTYSYLGSIAVGRGDRVGLGQTIGTTASTFHFGARIGSAYVDPAILLAGGIPGRPRVMLVPRPAAAAASGRSSGSLHSQAGPASAAPLRLEPRPGPSHGRAIGVLRPGSRPTAGRNPWPLSSR